jgi:hypothetical protein
MSGYLRCGFAAFLLAAGFAAPAASNALTDLFSPNAASEAATAAPAAAPTPAPEPCARLPGPSAAGQHWFYRLEGSRKCWYQAAEDSAAAKRVARHRVASRPVVDPQENEPVPRKQKAVEDARAELVNSAPAQTLEPAPAPQIKVVDVKVVDAAPVPMTAAAALAQPAPVLAKPGADQPTPDQPTPRRVDVEALLAQAPAASDEVASAPATTPIAAPAANAGGGEDWIASWLGVLLMALGFTALLSASGTLRRAIWPVRFANSGTELPVIVQNGRNEPSFGRSSSHRPAPAETSFSEVFRAAR